MSLAPGDPAPDFSLDDDTGRTWTLADLRGTRVVLYFYPKDDTPGCTRQACALRDTWQAVAATGAHVFGVSPDSVASHARFRDKYSLPFGLLADTERTAAAAYGALADGRIVRSSYLIDAEGRIERTWPKVGPDEHLDLVLEALSS
jgi:peroxiredoxin Q/BCP